MNSQEQPARARAVGINHVQLEVGDIDEAIAFYGRIFAFTLRSKSERFAAIDMGDQFLALNRGRDQEADDRRHFGFVVDDPETVRATLDRLGIPLVPGGRLNFRDPWGNRIEIVGYRGIQFSKSPAVLEGMALGHLDKSLAAQRELAEKGLGSAPDG